MSTKGLYKNPTEIVEEVVRDKGVFRKVFGDQLLNGLVYDEQMQADVEILENIYGFEKVGEIFAPLIDKGSFSKIAKIVFRIIEGPQQGIFAKKD